ncbi:hypothetical protein EVAR_48289_1 [Eumeta japonica]|uniref:Uncharacterized protein n=1 Tax=Eumeta variegata TaxID=151549 RepID=A0A4C1WJP8_EUMVA|nr:hypothetical protein EVAR_48289_1 [Eumeta japonica]
MLAFRLRLCPPGYRMYSLVHILATLVSFNLDPAFNFGPNIVPNFDSGQATSTGGEVSPYTVTCESVKLCAGAGSKLKVTSAKIGFTPRADGMLKREKGIRRAAQPANLNYDLLLANSTPQDRRSGYPRIRRQQPGQYVSASRVLQPLRSVLSKRLRSENLFSIESHTVETDKLFFDTDSGL